ncbi:MULTISPECIES: hypothetical protein [unclassified Nocardioides]|uniref:hypothetical protein n=1 Tax=unclassified Nocardioides TaxID=2615069 RepID=UPI0002F0F409|nr:MULTISPECIES: hypothetical protein [unclassified Nocardioides]
MVGASGLMAIYVAGLTLGNTRLPHRSATASFVEGLAWLSQIGLFVMLGLLVSPGRLLDARPYALVQGPTLPWVTRRLGATVDNQPQPVAIESAPLEKLDATLLQLTVGPGSRLAGVEVSELRLPQPAAVSLVLRGDQIFAPTGHRAARRRPRPARRRPGGARRGRAPPARRQ